LLQPLLMQAEALIAALALVFGLLILWVLVSIPVWIAAKVVTVGKARFTRAMLVTAAGPIVYAIVFFLSSAILHMTLGEKIFITTVAFILAFIAWIGVFKLGFDTGWLRALGIAILATIVFAVIGTIITIGLQALIPQAPPITPFPTF
jgi:predicted neutral ceramidase superfamily lipid hydrolase